MAWEGGIMGDGSKLGFLQRTCQRLQLPHQSRDWEVCGLAPLQRGAPSNSTPRAHAPKA